MNRKRALLWLVAVMSASILLSLKGGAQAQDFSAESYAGYGGFQRSQPLGR